MTMASPETASDHFLIRESLKLFPSLAPLARDPRNLVIVTSALMIIFVALKCALSLFVARRGSTLAERISLELASQALERYLALDYLSHLRAHSQDLIHNIINRAALAHFVNHLFFLYAYCLSCLTLFTALAIIEPKLTLVVALVFGLTALLIYSLVRVRLDRAGIKVRDLRIEESQELLAISQGIREILIYGRQKTALKRFQKFGQSIIPPRAIMALSNSIPAQTLEVVGFGTIGLMVIVMILSNLPLAEIISSTTILMLTAWRILPSVSRCLHYAVLIRGVRAQALACLESVELADSQARPNQEPDPDFAFNRELRLQRATFSYPEAAYPAVHDLSLTITKGQSVGLIGLSGSGKTTLALLLSGLVEPQTGEFLVDGQKLNPARKSAYFRILGYVPQNPLLVEGTLADNVAFSQWGEGWDLARTEAACREAAMDFVQTHPLGLSQPISRSSLSGGQSQRVAIARALYPQPQIIIFDEATSALDQASENIIKNTLERVQGQLTSIIIAHRLTTVEKCDTLIWLEAGQVKMVGPPQIVLPLYLKAMPNLAESGEETGQNKNQAPKRA
jgi:ABC-type multidrug transport system fused ATPase/permease subunit